MRIAGKFFRTAMMAVILAATVGSWVWAAPFLKSGDRVVIYGDSITEQRLYSRYLQQYIFCRYPELKVRFFNAGWSGDRANGALARLERDVLVLKPTVVTLFFGMNDGGYTAVDQGIVSTYRDNMDKLIQALLAKKIRVVVYAPGCVDYDKNPPLGVCKYNEMLQALGAADRELAAKYKLPFVDVNRAMLKVQTAEKAKDPAFTMIPDSVHPNPAGHEVMAYAMLQGLGAEPMPALGEVDVTSGKGNGLKVVRKSADKIVLETTKPALTPFWFAEECQPVMTTSGFIYMTAQALTIKGLTGAWKMTIDGDAIGGYAGDALSNGVLITGKHSSRGKSVHDIAGAKETEYFRAWREQRIGWFVGLPTFKQCVGATMALDTALHDSIKDYAAPRVVKIVLEKAE